MSGRSMAAWLLATVAVSVSVLVGFVHDTQWWVVTAIAVAGVSTGLSAYLLLPPSKKKKKKKKKRKKSRSGEQSSNDESASRAIRSAIKTGLVVFNVPNSMTQGQKERVEVFVARSTDLREALVSELRGRGEPQFEEIQTSIYMEVKLSGLTFEVIPHSPAEQLIIPEPARWEFDVLPCRAGRRQITLYITMRIEAAGIRRGRRRVSSLERTIEVKVNYSYATRRFVAANWQWLILALLALAGTVAAWLVVHF